MEITAAWLCSIGWISNFPRHDSLADEADYARLPGVVRKHRAFPGRACVGSVLSEPQAVALLELGMNSRSMIFCIAYAYARNAPNDASPIKSARCRRFRRSKLQPGKDRRRLRIRSPGTTGSARRWQVPYRRPTAGQEKYHLEMFRGKRCDQLENSNRNRGEKKFIVGGPDLRSQGDESNLDSVDSRYPPSAE